MQTCLHGPDPDVHPPATCLALWGHEVGHDGDVYPPCQTGVCPMATADPPDGPDLPL